MTRLTLETAGYEIEEAAVGRRGLEIFGDGSNWDAVLLDQQLPGIDGLETLRRVKERHTTARVMTACAPVELAVDAMRLGATDFVRQPVTPDALRNAVAAALSKPSTLTDLTNAEHASAAENGCKKPSPLTGTVTLNGFHIRRDTDDRSAPPQGRAERRFIVESTHGEVNEVIVKIDREAAPSRVLTVEPFLSGWPILPQQAHLAARANRLARTKDPEPLRAGNCQHCQGLDRRAGAVELGRHIKYYATPRCRGCPLKAQCTTSKGGRRITRWIDEDLLDEMAQRVKENPQLMKQRQQLSEHPFGTMKRAMNAGSFLMRGLKKVGAAMGLTVLAYNIKRVVKILGVEPMMGAVVSSIVP